MGDCRYSSVKSSDPLLRNWKLDALIVNSHVKNKARRSWEPWQMCTTTKCRITISMLKATMQLNISTLCRGTIQWHLCAACECQTKSLSAFCSALWTYVETCHRNCFVLSKNPNLFLQWLETLRVREKKAPAMSHFRRSEISSGLSIYVLASSFWGCI